jgi:membrane protein DedA with SNARE-associated domain
VSDVSPLDWITGSPWSYVVVALMISGSAVFPPLPSEASMFTALSLALEGELVLVAAAVACGVGSMGGDLLAYSVGRVAGSRRDDARAGEGRIARAIAWVDERDEQWGPGLIMGGRFVPGGATAVGLTAGVVRFPVRRFVTFSFLGAAVWVGYGVTLAYVGSTVLPGQWWVGTLVAVALGLAFAGAVKWRDSRKRSG